MPAIEPLSKPWVEECPTCHELTQHCVTAALTEGDVVLGGPETYRRCTNGCDDGEITMQGRTS